MVGGDPQFVVTRAIRSVESTTSTSSDELLPLKGLTRNRGGRNLSQPEGFERIMHSGWETCCWDLLPVRSERSDGSASGGAVCSVTRVEFGAPLLCEGFRQSQVGSGTEAYSNQPSRRIPGWPHRGQGISVPERPGGPVRTKFPVIRMSPRPRP